MIYSMLGGFFDSFVMVLKELFNFIPKVIYLLYSSLACLLDVLQLFFRKIAGLDVYYVNGQKQYGDLLSNFIGGILGFTSDGFSYSALSTVFWAFIVFGVIMVFVSTFVAVIKSHYSYDDKAAKGPMQYVYTGGKAIINIIAVPVIVFIGLFVSQALLTAVDSITSISSGTVDSTYGTTTIKEVDDLGQEVERVVSSASQYLESSETSTGTRTYTFYDIFGVSSGVIYNVATGQPLNQAGKEELSAIASTNATFSGTLFKLAAYNGNRARIGQYQVGGSFTGGGASEDTSGLHLFDNADEQNELADMIDTAFASNLHLKAPVSLLYDVYDGDLDCIEGIRTITALNTLAFNSFSKFNVGLVWYYYDLWQFNFIIGFAACIVCATLFINIILGLITRLLMCLGLFLVAPPLFGLSPIDGGKAGKNWTENFIKQVLMVYGAVVGMNLFFLILPYINNIDFFGPSVAIANLFAQTLIIITGLVMIKAFIAMISGIINSADAQDSGSKIAKEVGQVAGKATKMTVGAGKLGVVAPVKAVKGGIGLGKFAVGAVGTVGGALTTAVHAAVTGIQGLDKKAKESSYNKKQAEFEKSEKQNDFLFDLNENHTLGSLDKESFTLSAQKAGFDNSEIKTMWKNIGAQRKYAKENGIDADKSYVEVFDILSKDSRTVRPASRPGTARKLSKELGEDEDREEFLRKQEIRKAKMKQAQNRYALSKASLGRTASWTGGAGKLTFKGGADVVKSAGSYVTNPIDNFANVTTGHDMISEFKKGAFKKKKDAADQTAENTKATADNTKAMAENSAASASSAAKAEKSAKQARESSEKSIEKIKDMRTDLDSMNERLNQIDTNEEKIVDSLDKIKDRLDINR